MRFQGKNILITGGTSGIGEACAYGFAKEGGRVMICARREEQGRTVAEKILAAGGQANFTPCDLANPEDIRRTVEATLTSYGTLDVLVNTVGYAVPKGILEITEEEWDKCMQINMKSIFHMVRAVLPSMQKSGGGSIVNVSSALAFVASPNFTAYCTAKGAILSLTKSLALDFAKDNIRVNCLCPGAVETPFLLAPLEKYPALLDEITKMHPLGRLSTPEEQAKAVLFLASSDASFVTGAHLVADGGYSIW